MSVVLDPKVIQKIMKSLGIKKKFWDRRTLQEGHLKKKVGILMNPTTLNMKMSTTLVLMLIIPINFSSSQRSRLNNFTLLFWQLIEVRLN